MKVGTAASSKSASASTQPVAVIEKGVMRAAPVAGDEVIDPPYGGACESSSGEKAAAAVRPEMVSSAFTRTPRAGGTPGKVTGLDHGATSARVDHAAARESDAVTL